MTSKMLWFWSGSFFALAILGIVNIDGQSKATGIPLEWQTTAERTNYAKTSTYDEAVAFSKRLADSSGGCIVYQSYGKSGEGRDLPLLIATEGKTFTPAAARAAGKAVILVQAISRRSVVIRQM